MQTRCCQGPDYPESTGRSQPYIPGLESGHIIAVLLFGREKAVCS